MEEGTGTILLASLLGLPWLVILVDAFLLGFNLTLSVIMLTVFAFGVLFAAGFGADA